MNKDTRHVVFDKTRRLLIFVKIITQIILRKRLITTKGQKLFTITGEGEGNNRSLFMLDDCLCGF